MKKGHKGFHLLVFLAVFAAAVAVVMLLWNALIPAIIGWSAITYWQAAGLLVLCRLLLGGIGHLRNGMFMGGPHKKRVMEEMHRKFHGMSPDQRRDFIRRRMEEFRDPREGFDPCDSDGPKED